MTSIDAGSVTGTTVGPDTDRTTSIRPFEPIGKDQLDNDHLAPIVDEFLSYILIIETKTTTTIREYEEFGECHNMIARNEILIFFNFHQTLELKDILIKNSKDMFIELFSVEQVGTTIKEYEPTPIGKFYLFFCCCYILIIFLMEG